MKRLFFMTIFCSCPVLSSVYAQSPYQNIENFQAGTTLVFQNCKTDTFEPGKQGKNVTWDFSHLKPGNDTVIQRITAPDPVIDGNEYPQSTLVERYAGGSSVYLKTEENKTYLLGFVNKKSKVMIKYPQPALLAQRPFSYGDTAAEPYTTAYSANGMDFAGTGMATIKADGLGTLILPNKTYPNVLRIKIIQKQYDRMKQYRSTSETTVMTYVWFDQEHSSALLKMTETSSQYYSDKSIEYLLSETVE